MVKKFYPPVKLNVKTYEPEEKIRLKEDAVPVLVEIGSRLGAFGDALELFVSAIFSGIRGIFIFKDRARMLKKGERVLDFRCRKG